MTFDRGSVLVLQVEFKKQTPFGTLDYFDPTVPKITITDPGGTDKVSAADLTKSTVGKYYYLCQTATTWMPGKYKTKVTATDGSYTDVTVDPEAFELI